MGAEHRVEGVPYAHAAVLDRLAEARGGAVVLGDAQRVRQQDGGALLGGDVVDEQRRGGAALLGVVQVDDDHVALLRSGGGRGVLLLPGAVEERQLARVPEVADAADGEEGEDDDQGDHPVAAAAAGLLAALGPALGELEPVDDVLGVLVRLVDERELLGAVVGRGLPVLLGPARFGDLGGARGLRLGRGGRGGGSEAACCGIHCWVCCVCWVSYP